MIKQTTIAIITILCIIGVVGAANQSFNVGVTVCSTSWYCTNYSSITCGTRTCIDVNACGINTNKPAEFLQCTTTTPSESSSGGGGGGSGGYATVNTLPAGYFTTDSDIISLSVKQNTITQKIIIVNTTLNGEHTLEIISPANSTTKKIVTTSNNNKNIENKGDFNLIIDTRNSTTGTYVIIAKISNKNYSKSIKVTIDVILDDARRMNIYLDSNVKQIGIDKDITVNLKTEGLNVLVGDNVTYNIIDPLGNVIHTENRIITDPSTIEQKIILPQNLGEGYYTLAANIQIGENDYSKSTTFTLITPDKYMPEIQSPLQSPDFGKKMIWTIFILIISGLVVLYILTIDKSNKLVAEKTRTKEVKKHNPIIKIHFNINDMFRNITKKSNNTNSYDKHDSEMIQKRNETLRESYETGFISLSEYSNAIHSRGEPSEKDKEHILREEKKIELQEKEAAEKKKKEEEREKKEEEKEQKKEEERRAEEQKHKEEEKKKEERKKQEEERKASEEKRKKEEKERKESAEQKRKEEEKHKLEEKKKREIEKKKEEETKKEKQKREAEERIVLEEKRKKEEEKRKIEEKETAEKKKEEKRKTEEQKRKEEEREKEQKKTHTEKEKKHVEEKHKVEEHHKKEKISDEVETKHHNEKVHIEKIKTDLHPHAKSDVLDVRVRDSEAFVLNNNELLHSLRDLLNALPNMPERVLHHHIKHGRNDFAKWIEDVFQQPELAEEIKTANNHEDMIRILSKHA